MLIKGCSTNWILSPFWTHASCDHSRPGDDPEDEPQELKSRGRHFLSGFLLLFIKSLSLTILPILSDSEKFLFSLFSLMIELFSVEEVGAKIGAPGGRGIRSFWVKKGDEWIQTLKRSENSFHGRGSEWIIYSSHQHLDRFFFHFTHLLSSLAGNMLSVWLWILFEQHTGMFLSSIRYF